MDTKQISFNYKRKFGVELEFNSFDMRDFYSKPLQATEYPEGGFYIANLLETKLYETVNVVRWMPIHNNKNWVLKPDRSCGLELCTPVLSGWNGLRTLLAAVDLLSNDDNIKCDNRCSLHMHVSVDDLTVDEIKSVLAYWIKFEHIFLDSVPDHRKRNKYCQSIGNSPVFEHNEFQLNHNIIDKLSTHKYWTLNTWRYGKKDRKTIEFRIIESEACKDAYLVKNWVRLIIHFIEVVKDLPFPSIYQEGNRWTSLLWLNLTDLFNLLGFLNSELSTGMVQTRNWFLARLNNNLDSNLPGIWSPAARQKAKKELQDIIKYLRIKNINEYLYPSDRLSLFNNGF